MSLEKLSEQEWMKRHTEWTVEEGLANRVRPALKNGLMDWLNRDDAIVISKVRTDERYSRNGV